MLHAVIMAGGGGTRFWPRSRISRPKQFLSLHHDRTLIQQTFDRLEIQVPGENCWVITSAQHAGQVAYQISDIPANQIIGEPFGRDTAACIGLGAALLSDQDPEATMLVCPADHAIEPAEQFRKAVQVAEKLVEEKPAALVTFGIAPTYPATGYGYIQRGEKIATRQGCDVYQVNSFKEKPDEEVARAYLQSGEYYWNGGIFVWKAKTILAALAENQPELFESVETIAQSWTSADKNEIFRREYEKINKISIDYAVMEKAKEVLVVEAPFKWDDVGSWAALERLNPQDANGNTVLGQHCGIDTEDCVIVADEEGLIATAGVKDLVIVRDGDAVLVANKNDENAVKKLVERLKEQKLENYL